MDQYIHDVINANASVVRHRCSGSDPDLIKEQCNQCNQKIQDMQTHSNLVKNAQVTPHHRTFLRYFLRSMDFSAHYEAFLTVPTSEYARSALLSKLGGEAIS
jgi:methionyl-tRNA synthetase